MKRNSILVCLLIFLVSCKNPGIKEKAVLHAGELKKIALDLNTDFKKIREEAALVAENVKWCYEHQNSILRGIKKDKYSLSQNGIFYKPVNDGGAAVFVSGIVPVTNSVKNTVYFTEPLDTILINTTKKYPEIVQIYYNDENSYNRIFPYFDVLAQYEPKMRIPDFNFYFLADEKHNPERKAVWVNEPYVDPAGRGWMISAIAPVYFKGKFVGVPGIDVTINTITDRYFFDKPDRLLMLVDSSGTIVTARENVINLLSFPPIKDHKYIETIKLNTYRKESYNILMSKDADTRQIANKIMHEGSRFFKAKINNEEYYLISEFIPELNWHIIEIVK